MREADVSIGPLMADKPELIQEYLMSFHMKLYASQHYLDTHGVLEKPEDLSHHKLIIFGYDAASPYSDVNWLLKVGMPKGTLREPYLCVNAGLAMQKAAEAHHGIVSLSAEHHAINNSTLVEILPALEKPIIPIYYIYTHDMQHSKRIQMLGDHLKKQCQQ
jgi:DNA-binding transcriptional LysR family regulator